MQIVIMMAHCINYKTHLHRSCRYMLDRERCLSLNDFTETTDGTVKRTLSDDEARRIALRRHYSRPDGSSGRSSQNVGSSSVLLLASSDLALPDTDVGPPDGRLST